MPPRRKRTKGTSPRVTVTLQLSPETTDHLARRAAKRGVSHGRGQQALWRLRYYLKRFDRLTDRTLLEAAAQLDASKLALAKAKRLCENQYEGNFVAGSGSLTLGLKQAEDAINTTFSRLNRLAGQPGGTLEELHQEATSAAHACLGGVSCGEPITSEDRRLACLLVELSAVPDPNFFEPSDNDQPE